MQTHVERTILEHQVYACVLKFVFTKENLGKDQHTFCEAKKVNNLRIAVFFSG